ncbi:EDS1L-like protein, partial [Tanacetum coccineum]
YANGYQMVLGPQETIFAFDGSWSVQDFYNHEPFGETKVDIALFPSLKSIGNNEVAMINQGFFLKFLSILQTTSFKDEVEKTIKDGKPIIFTGHSTGGPVAILVAGDRIFTHALNREKWSHFFLHFVGRYDIVPRITLASFSSVRNEFGQILDFFNPESRNFQNPSIQTSQEASTFFKTVLKNASSIASHTACNLTGSTNSLLETISSFVQLSPYRPSGTYVFCTGNGKMVSVKNSNAVLQILFFSSQSADEADLKNAASRSLYMAMAYHNELKESLLGMQDVVYLEDETEIPLSSNSSVFGDTASLNTALKDLGLGTRARLSLRATQAFEKQKAQNQTKIESKKPNIMKMHNVIADYQKACEDRKIGYYDAFKIQKGNEDFEANVKRLELAGIWDEIVEMLKRYELPDGLDSNDNWIELGTKFRKLVEPLDIANYYRHSKDDDTGSNLSEGGRPKRYKYTQRWREHAQKLEEGASSETTFWAKVEELKRKTYEKTKEQIIDLEKQVTEWVKKEEVGKDVFLEKSTFVEWWKTLPEKHRSESCLIVHLLALPFEVPTLGVVAYGVVAWTRKKKGANRDQHSRDQRARSGGLWSGGLDPKRGANRDQHSRDQRGRWFFKGWGIVMIPHRPTSPTFRGSNTRSGGLWSGGLDSKRVPTVTNIAVTNELGVVAYGVVAWTQRGVPTVTNIAVTNEDVGSSKGGVLL